MEFFSETQRTIIKILMAFFASYFSARWFNKSSAKYDIYFYYTAIILGHLIAGDNISKINS